MIDIGIHLVRQVPTLPNCRATSWADALALRGSRFGTSLSLPLGGLQWCQQRLQENCSYMFKRRIISGDTETLGFHRGLRSVSAVIAARETFCSKQLYALQGCHSAMLQRSLLTQSKHAS